MKLSILLLTHNRPKLFQRALNSILDILPDYDVEVLVNNDTRDIKEINHKCVTYYYKTSNDLSDLYHYLYTKSKGEYIFYLEDDDYLLKNFFNEIDFNYDINYFHYYSAPLISELGVLPALRRLCTANQHLENISNAREFIKKYKDRDFQLSQILFKKDLLNNNIFPKGNNINNDFILFKKLISTNTTIKYISKTCWVQTIDGNDNISFNE